MKEGTKNVLLKIVQVGLVAAGAIVSGVISDRQTKRAVNEYMDAHSIGESSTEETEEA